MGQTMRNPFVPHPKDFVENKRVKNLPLLVIPSKAGSYVFNDSLPFQGPNLDSRLRGNDNSEGLL